MLKKGEILRLKQIDHVMSEINILSEIDHPFLVLLFSFMALGQTFRNKPGQYLFISPLRIYQWRRTVHVYENRREIYCRDRKVIFLRIRCRFYSGQVILMFESLHLKDIVYRDLKPENLLLTSNGYLKLVDFGFAKQCKTRTYTLCGTPEYLAPEILLNKGHGKPVDWWCLGIMIYEMLAGQAPFTDEDPMQVYQKILKGKVKFPRTFDK